MKWGGKLNDIQYLSLSKLQWTSRIISKFFKKGWLDLTLFKDTNNHLRFFLLFWIEKCLFCHPAHYLLKLDNKKQCDDSDTLSSFICDKISLSLMMISTFFFLLIIPLVDANERRNLICTNIWHHFCNLYMDGLIIMIIYMFMGIYATMTSNLISNLN